VPSALLCVITFVILLKLKLAIKILEIQLHYVSVNTGTQTKK